MNELRIPTTLAVGFWLASGLTVLGYTYLAFKETANGQGSGANSQEKSDLAADPAILQAEQQGGTGKQLNRKKFDKLKPIGITPKELGF